MKGHIDLLHLKYFKHILNCKTESLILTLFFFQNIGEYEEFLNEKFLHGGVNITGFKFLTKMRLDANVVTNELKMANTVARNYTMSVMFRRTNSMINMFLKR